MRIQYLTDLALTTMNPFSVHKAVVSTKSGQRLHKRVRQSLQKPNFLGDICINDLKWSEFILQKAICKIEEWKIPQGLLLECADPKILIKMNDVKFTQIKKLSLRANRIESIQNICLIQMPCLQKLILSDNRIIDMNSIRKSNLPNLQLIQIDQNFITRIDKFFEFDAPNLKKINSDKPNKYSGVQWVFKMQSNLKTLQISSFKRIQQPQQLEAVNRKFLSIHIIKKWW